MSEDSVLKEFEEVCKEVGGDFEEALGFYKCKLPKGSRVELYRSKDLEIYIRKGRSRKWGTLIISNPKLYVHISGRGTITERSWLIPEHNKRASILDIRRAPASGMMLTKVDSRYNIYIY